MARAAARRVGAFASRLNLELRERLGYSYGIGGGFSPGVGESQFTVGGSVRTEVAADAVARLLDGLELRDPFTAAEIDDARRYLVGVAPLANETSADIVGQASALAAAGLDAGYMNRHFADLGVVTPAQATEAFRDEVRPDTLTVAVAGAAEQLLPALAARGLAAEVVDLRD
ncbi:M16 family metallopeptidase [Tessaracoccus lapidicaptus]|uniref:M16 family metallopeptidase n=1 Tax=Tessaracoccus lapidicaptus TaxID=1427523 RepID=UPI0033428033